MFSCWTGDCGKGITPWYFVAKYYNLDNFKDIAKKINELGVCLEEYVKMNK